MGFSIAVKMAQTDEKRHRVLRKNSMSQKEFYYMTLNVKIWINNTVLFMHVCILSL